jgi:hypothetical protein
VRARRLEAAVGGVPSNGGETGHACSTYLSTGAAVALMISTLCVSPALATPGSGFTPAPIVNGHFGTLNVNTSKDKTDKWGLHLKTLDDTDIGAG